MTNIDTLADRMVAAKERIAEAQAEYNEALAEWLAVAPTRDEGSVTTHGDSYKVTTTYGITRSVDEAALRQAWAWLPEAARDVFRVKHAVDTKALRTLQELDPHSYTTHVAPLVTAKPGKPQVKVERIENEAAKAA